MRIAGWFSASFLLLAGCGEGGGADPTLGNNVSADAPANNAATAATPAGPARQAARWELRADSSGSALIFQSASGDVAIALRCSPKGTLRVDVPGFRTIGSEDRLSFGSGGEVVALVATIKGDGQAGVSASGDVPSNLAALIAGPVSASYGAQKSGPHPAPPSSLARAFVEACGTKAGARAPAAAPAPGAAAPGACMKQGDEILKLSPLRAVGTEPFWGARIEGRCVTYNHPEDIKGTRVWTRYTPGPDGGIWSGALGGKKFELRTRSKAGCSDGMSDERYPLAVELLVGGERRTGCAEPL